MAVDLVDKAIAEGADAAEIQANESFGLSVAVRAGKRETCEFGQECAIGVKVHVGKRTGSASCGSFDQADISQVIARALVIARSSEDDEFAGLPEPDTLAELGGEDLSLHHPWRPEIGEAVRIATECEQAAFAADGRVSRAKSEGAEVSSSESRSALANSHGFASVNTTSSHSVSCGAVAEVQDGMEAGGWYSVERDAARLEAHTDVGRIAAERAVARDGARPAHTARVAVIIETGAAHSLVGSLLGALSGGNLYRRLSYLRDAAGTTVCAGHLSVREDPFVPAGKRSCRCDAEGVAVVPRAIVSAGVLQGYLLSSYSARKLGMRTTGNAGGAHNTYVEGRTVPLRQLFEDMGTGFFVTALMGQGANLVTGDYSCGASGFWVENGSIAYPVREATLAGTLPEMLASIAALGDDVRDFGGMHCGSLLLGEMAMGGKN